MPAATYMEPGTAGYVRNPTDAAIPFHYPEPSNLSGVFTYQ